MVITASHHGPSSRHQGQLKTPFFLRFNERVICDEIGEKTARQVVLGGLVSAGVPIAICEGILDILARAGHAPLLDPPKKSGDLLRLCNVEECLPRLLDRMATIKSSASYRQRQVSYEYALWATRHHRGQPQGISHR